MRRPDRLLAVVAGLLAVFNLFALIVDPPTWPIAPRPLHVGPVVMTPPPMPHAGREFTVASTATLVRVFDRADYRLDAVRSREADVPRLYLAALPHDIADLSSVERRKQVFLRVVLPLVLRVNREIEIDQVRAAALIKRAGTGETLTARDKEWLIALAQRYGVAGDEAPFRSLREALSDDQRGELLKRVREIPTSLALAQAVVESGWGRSRFSREGNALFGQWTWSKDQGIAPAGAPDAAHSVRRFRSLSDSVRAYMHNLNTHATYADFRHARARDAKPKMLAGLLTHYSERREAYVEELRTVMDQNRLSDFDAVDLGATFLRPTRPWEQPAG